MIAIIERVCLYAVIALAGFMAYDKFYVRPVGGESVVAKDAPAVTKQPTAAVTIKAPIKAYQGRSKELLKLPAAVQQDANKEVIAATQTPASLRPTTTSTVIDKQTGEVTTFTKVDPYPWLAVETRGTIGLAYGYKYNHVLHGSAPVARLNVGYDVIRIKALTVGLQATVDSDSTAFAGVGVKYQW